MKPVYPWQSKQASFITRLLTEEKLPQTMLLYGPSGLGIGDFALALANERLKKSSSLIKAVEGHPDFYRLGAKNSSIEKVRQLQAALLKTAKLSESKVVVLEGLDAVNLKVGNALLKILEEPPHDVFFILTANELDSVLPTILSRAFKVSFMTATESETKLFLQENGLASFWLPLINGCPLKALRWKNSGKEELFQEIIERVFSEIKKGKNVYSLASSFSKLELDETFFLLEYLMVSTIKEKLSSALNRTSIVNIGLKNRVNVFKGYETLLQQLKFHQQRYLINKERLVETCLLSMSKDGL